MINIASLIVKVGADVRDATSGLSSVDQSFEATRKRAETFERDLKRFTLGALGGVSAIAVGSAKMAIDFESSFAGVRKTVDATEAEYAELAQTFRDMAKEIPVNVNELNRIAEAAGQLGVGKEDIADFTRTVAALGDTTNLAGEQAAVGIARFANVTGMAISETSNFAAALVGLGNAGASTESEILDMSLRIAGAGTQIGLTEAQILGFANALASVGIEAEAGGTAISRVFVDIDKAVADGGEKLSMFAQVSGMSAQQFAQAWGQDASAATLAFIGGLKGVSDAGGNVFQVLEDLELGEIRVRDTLLRATTANDLFADSLRMSGDLWVENNAHIEEANKRWETTASRLRIAMNHVTDLAISVGERLLPAVVTLADKASENLPRAFDWVNQNLGREIEAIASAMTTLGNVAEEVARWLAANEEVAVPLAQAIGIATVAMVGLGVAMLAIGVMTNPFFAAYVGITALSLAVLIAIDEWEQLRQKYEAVDRAASFTAETFRLMGQGFATWGGWIADAIRGFDDFLSMLGEIPGALWDAGVEAAKAFARGIEHGAVDIARAAQQWLDPRNWDIPGGSPLMDAMDHFGFEAGETFTAAMAGGIDAGAPVVESRVQALASRVRNLMDQMFGFILNTSPMIGPAVDTDLHYKGDPKQGPFLGMDADQIAAANQQAIEDRFKSLFTGFGSGGGGGAGSVAKSAAEEFAAAWEDELRSGALADAFGETGSSLLMSFADALDSPAGAARLPDIIGRLVDEAREEGVPNAEELGNELAAAIARGLESGSDAEVQAALGELTAAVKAAGELTIDTFAKALGAEAAESATVSKIGSAGKSLMDSLNRAIDEGGKTNIAKLAEHVNKMADTLMDKVPEGQAAFLGSSMMDALNRAIELRSPEAISTLTAVMAQINTVLMGGAIDIRTGTTIAAEAVKELADAFDVNADVIVGNIGVIIDSGLIHMIGALDQLPVKASEAITKLLATLAAGKGDVDSLADQIARNLPGYDPSTGTATGDTSQPMPGANLAEEIKRITGIDVNDPNETEMLTYANGFHLSSTAIQAMGLSNFVRGWMYGEFTSAPRTAAYMNDPNALDTLGRPSVSGSHKDGLDYVPFDGYIAELHRGERVVPADQNLAGIAGSRGKPGEPIVVNQHIEHYHAGGMEGDMAGGDLLYALGKAGLS